MIIVVILMISSMCECSILFSLACWQGFEVLQKSECWCINLLYQMKLELNRGGCIFLLHYVKVQFFFVIFKFLWDGVMDVGGTWCSKA